MKKSELKKFLRKKTPLASIILKREELRNELHKSDDWMSKMTKIMGEIATGKEDDNAEKIEDELIEISAIAILWIEELRKK